MIVQVDNVKPDRTQQNTDSVMNGLMFDSCKTLVNECPFSSQQELFSNKPRQDRRDASLVGQVGIMNGVLGVTTYGHTCHLKGRTVSPVGTTCWRIALGMHRSSAVCRELAKHRRAGEDS